MLRYLVSTRKGGLLFGSILAAILSSLVISHYIVTAHASDNNDQGSQRSRNSKPARKAADRDLPLSKYDVTHPKGKCCGASERATEFSPISPDDYQSYKLSGVYYTLRENLAVTLMLNNKGPQPVPVRATAYSLAGNRLVLPPISVPAASYIEVDMYALFAGAADEFKEGSMKIVYEGGNMQLGAQIKMVDTQNKLIWAEQFVYTSKFPSTKLESVWWMPFEGSSGRIAVSNTTSQTVTAALDIDGTAPKQDAPFQVTLAPWQTLTLNIVDGVIAGTNWRLKKVGGVSISHNGTPGAVLARMYIGNPDKGYSSSVPFIDPEATGSQRWNGAGLRLRFNGQTLDSTLVARNTGDEASILSGRMPYTKPDGSIGSITIPSRSLPANSTKEIDLDALIDAADLPASVEFAGIELNYTSARGTIVTSVQSMSHNGEHVFQVPMMDPDKLPSSSGGFPWKADGDFRSLIYIKNETAVTRIYTANILYEGGGYSLGQNEIKPGETVVIDFKKLRDEQKPDSMGTVIPLNLVKGQMHWSAVGPAAAKTLSGRSEQVSSSGGIASTYACYGCCSDILDDAWIDGDGLMAVGESGYFSAIQRDKNCNNQLMTPYAVTRAITWYSNSTSVAQMDSAGRAEGVAPGDTYVGAFWDTTREDGSVGYCQLYQERTERSFPIKVTPIVTIGDFGAVGKNLTMPVVIQVSPTNNSQSITLNIRRTTGTGDAVFNDTGTTTKAITTSQTVQVKGNTESSTQNNFVLEAKIGNNTLPGARTFTVISVTLSLRTSGSVSSNNSKASAYNTVFGTTSLGMQQGTAPGLKWWGAGVEIVGTVLPTNFSQNIILNRELVAKKEFKNSNPTPTFTQGLTPDSVSDYRDDTPSGGSPNNVYDLDGPGIGSESFDLIGDIIRYRTNFNQWAEFNNVRVSPIMAWFACVSVEKTSSNASNDVLNNSVSNDNRAGTGSINLTWNLQ